MAGSGSDEQKASIDSNNSTSSTDHSLLWGSIQSSFISAMEATLEAGESKVSAESPPYDTILCSFLNRTVTSIKNLPAGTETFTHCMTALQAIQHLITKKSIEFNLPKPEDFNDQQYALHCLRQALHRQTTLADATKHYAQILVMQWELLTLITAEIARLEGPTPWYISNDRTKLNGFKSLQSDGRVDLPTAETLYRLRGGLRHFCPRERGIFASRDGITTSTQHYRTLLANQYPSETYHSSQGQRFPTTIKADTLLGKGAFKVVCAYSDTAVWVTRTEPAKAKKVSLEKEIAVLELLGDLHGICLEHDQVVGYWAKRYPGQELHKYIEAHKASLTLTHYIRLLLAMAHALQNLHQLNIIHFDVKPANCLFDPNCKVPSNAVKWVDFGFSRVGEGPHPRPGGTPGYQAVETSPKSEIEASFEADVFSLGASLLWMLAPDLFELFTPSRTQPITRNYDAIKEQAIPNKLAGRFTEASQKTINHLNSLLQSMLEEKFKKRPTLDLVISRLTELCPTAPTLTFPSVTPALSSSAPTKLAATFLQEQNRAAGGPHPSKPISTLSPATEV